MDTKYATQQWVARGLPKAAAKQQLDAVTRKETELEQRERAGRQAKGGKAAAKAGKGFGSKVEK